MEQLRNAFESLSNWWFDLHYSHTQKRTLLIIGILLIALSVFVVSHGNSQHSVAAELVPMTIAEPEIFVDVTGAVNKPGVYSLTGKSRVIDAIKAAGDSSPGADLSTINLARVLTDGEQIYIDATVVNSFGVRVTKTVRSGPININRATAGQLDGLDGIGPDPVAEDKCLRNLGITDIPLLILSHFHADHVGGLSGLLRSRDVDQVWISNNLQPIMESTKSLSMLSKSKILTVQKGLIAQIAGIKFEVLWPENTTRTFASLPGDGSEINNSSIAMLVTTADWNMFTAGDLELPAQNAILGAVREVDIYKVCHHGSRYQDRNLLSALSAQVAVISVGAKNTYGHPAPETIAFLTTLGTQVVRTDTDGAVAITAKKHHLQVRKSKGTIRLFYWS